MFEAAMSEEIWNVDWLTETEEDLAVATDEKENNQLILYNDEVNTFDFVIETLIEVCDHDLMQAEQCTMIVHYNGKCAVKEGSYEDLKPLCIEMLERGLSAEIA